MKKLFAISLLLVAAPLLAQVSISGGVKIGGSGSGGSNINVNGGSTLGTASLTDSTGAGEIDWPAPSGATVKATLHNTSTTVNGVPCTLGSTCTISGGGGGSIIPTNATFIYCCTSINDDDSESLSPSLTISSWTISGSGPYTITLNTSAAHHLTTSNWASLRFATSWPACPAGETLGTNCTLFQITVTSSTQITFTTPAGFNPGACPSSCGRLHSAMSYLPFATSASLGFPAAALANTVVYIPSPVTISGGASGYATFIHPHSFGATGNPAYLIIDNLNNDAGTCTSNASTETAYQTLFSSSHTDGDLVVVGSPTGTWWNQLGLSCSTAYNLQYFGDQWLRQQGKTSVLATAPTSTQYWDIFSDLHAVLWDGSNTNNIVASNSGLAPTGASLAALTLSADIVSGNGTAKAANPLWYGAITGSGLANVTANLYVPFTGANTNDFVWTNAARTANIMTIDDSGNLVTAGWVHVAGCGGAGRPFCTAGTQIDGSGNLFMGGDIHANNILIPAGDGITVGTGPSNNKFWNTNGGITSLVQVHPIAFSGNGTAAYTASQVVVNYKSGIAQTIPSGGSTTLLGVACTSEFGLATAATATTTFSLNDNGTPFGTVAITSGGGVTITISSPQSVAVGDLVQVVAPSSADATAAGLYGSLCSSY